MQSVSSTFAQAANGTNRVLAFETFISWIKDYNNAIQFFTIGTSKIGGTDFIPGNSSSLFVFDQYSYSDESNYAMEYEYEREFAVPLSGISQAQATIMLANTSNRFTPNVDATIGNYVALSGRPVKLWLGFKNPRPELVQVFVGYSQPIQHDFTGKTVTFKAVDALKYIYNYTFATSLMYTSQYTDQVIASILQIMGFTASQYKLDKGFNQIPFVWADVGVKAGDLLKELAESELGHLYVDENGLIVFANRDNWKSRPLAETITDADIFDFTNTPIEKVINIVEVRSDVRQVQVKQKVWTLEGVNTVPPSGTLELFANFSDPVVSLSIPSGLSAITDSYFRAYDDAGNDQSALVNLTFTGFAQAAKLVFSNTSGLLLTLSCDIWGAPARVVNSIYVKGSDATSIARFEERPLQIQNDYITTNDAASLIADYIIANWAGGLTEIELKVKGKPQRQLGDIVKITSNRLPGSGFFSGYVTSIVGQLVRGQFKQTIKVLGSFMVNKGSTIFTIGVSTIAGPDKISPT